MQRVMEHQGKTIHSIRTGIACNLDHDILAAALPLLEEELVDAVEWSFDALYQHYSIPAWFEELLHVYSKAGRLIGHGVFFSLFSGRWLPEQEAWLKDLKRLSSVYRFSHITEHFGFMTGRDFHHGAPLNIPFTENTLALGRDRLARIADACGVPVGLENLAFAYSAEEVRRHGEFLDRLVSPVNGFIILDLHNLYCQLHNFSADFNQLIRSYPLERVREIHISGGSWEDGLPDGSKKVRRDTHDDGVPDEVFSLLEQTIPLCPNLCFVIMEQLGTALKSSASRERFRADFRKMRAIIESFASKLRLTNHFTPLIPAQLGAPVEDEQLWRQQLTLSEILETAASFQEASNRLKNSSLQNSGWQIETWAPDMIETARKIAVKWKNPVT